jgi:hypothetical protein
MASRGTVRERRPKRSSYTAHTGKDWQESRPKLLTAPLMGEQVIVRFAFRARQGFGLLWLAVQITNLVPDDVYDGERS